MKNKCWPPAKQKDVKAATITAVTLVAHAKQTFCLEMQAEANDEIPSVRVCSLAALQTDSHSLRMQGDDAQTNRIDLVYYRKKETE